MNNLLVAVFDTAPQAYKGLIALKELNKSQAIKLYSAVVIDKDASGTVHIRQVSKRKLAAPLGSFAGGLLGLLKGLRGLAVGTALGTLSGLPYDFIKAEVSHDFRELVSQTLEPGKIALLADLDETSVTPVDTELVKLEGKVYRQQYSQMIDEQIAQDLDSPVYREPTLPGPGTSIYLH